jgi:hypothetical protein
MLISYVFAGAFDLRAQGVVWTGPMFSFTNTAGSNPALAENQDQLTEDVWFTRAAKKGIFNIAPGQENAYQFDSPRGTEWAVGALLDYASLTYTNWAACYGGQGNLLSNITATNAVVHLINSDIYLALTFTSWGGSAGGFSYQRSTPLAVPEPSLGTLALISVVSVVVFRCWRKSKSACSTS